MFKVGEKIFFRSVTYHLLGEIESVQGDWLKLKNASWIADSGRFHEAIADGTLSEVEYVGEAYVNTNAGVDAFPWKHDLPTTSK